MGNFQKFNSLEDLKNITPESLSKFTLSEFILKNGTTIKLGDAFIDARNVPIIIEHISGNAADDTILLTLQNTKTGDIYEITEDDLLKNTSFYTPPENPELPQFEEGIKIKEDFNEIEPAEIKQKEEIPNEKERTLAVLAKFQGELQRREDERKVQEAKRQEEKVELERLNTLLEKINQEIEKRKRLKQNEDAEIEIIVEEVPEMIEQKDTPEKNSKTAPKTFRKYFLASVVALSSLLPSEKTNDFLPKISKEGVKESSTKTTPEKQKPENLISIDSKFYGSLSENAKLAYLFGATNFDDKKGFIIFDKATGKAYSIDDHNKPILETTEAGIQKDNFGFIHGGEIGEESNLNPMTGEKIGNTTPAGIYEISTDGVPPGDALRYKGKIYRIFSQTGNGARDLAVHILSDKMKNLAKREKALATENDPSDNNLSDGCISTTEEEFDTFIAKAVKSGTKWIIVTPDNPKEKIGHYLLSK